MKIAFVYANIARIGWNSYNKLGREDDDCFTIPHGIMYLKALLHKDKKHEADVIDFRMLSGPDEYKQKLLDGRYDIVGVSCLSPSRDYGVMAGKIAKEMGLITLAGGIHASVAPDDFISTGYFDCIIIGEAEKSFFEVLDIIENGKELPRIYKTINYVENLDELPFPATAYLPSYKNAFDINGRMAGIIGTRGCPGRCKYCWPNQLIMYGSKRIRRRSPKNIIDEMLYLKNNFSIRTIAFYDDTFTWDKAWLREFTAYIKNIKKGGIRLPTISVNARADIFDEEIAELLKEAGCIGAWFGFESGSPRILKIINKGCTLEQNIRAAMICKEAKLDLNANMLVGIPGETEEDYVLSYKFLEKTKPFNVRYNILTPYPGSAFYNEFFDKGLINMENYEDLEVNRPYKTKKGVIKNVDYSLVLKWAEPFRAFQKQAHSARRKRYRQATQGFLSKIGLDRYPLFMNMICLGYKSLVTIYHLLRRIYIALMFPLDLFFSLLLLCLWIITLVIPYKIYELLRYLFYKKAPHLPKPQVIFLSYEGRMVAPTRIRCYEFSLQLKKYNITTSVFAYWDDIFKFKKCPADKQRQIYNIEKMIANVIAFLKLYNRKNVIIYHQRPSYDFFVALFLHWVKGCSIVVDIDDYILDDNIFEMRGYGFLKIRQMLKLYSLYVNSWVASSHYLYKELAIYSKKRSLLPTYINTEKFYPKNSQPPKDKKVIFGWAGTIFHDFDYDNIIFLLDCFEMLCEKIKEDNEMSANLVIAAKGNRYLDEIKKIIKKYYKNYPISIKDWIDPNKMPEFLQGIDIGLYALVKKTKFNISKSPTKIFEYMACGKPTISTDFGEATYFIDDGKTGFLVSGRKNFIERMYLLAKNPQLRKSMGEEARRQAEKRFSQEAIKGYLYEILFKDNIKK